MSNLAYKLKKNNDYDINVDNVIRELYYENYSSNIIDTNRIYSYIEEMEGIKLLKYNIDSKEGISCLDLENRKITMSVRYASDKDPEVIGKKVQRKHEVLIVDKIPWSIKLIKDWKRMSIILKSEYDIYLFIENKKKLFGHDFSKDVYIPDERILIRIYEIKNGFYEIKADEESGDYRDLKIIYEVIVLDIDMAFFIECQVHLENLIIYKKMDHILYDFERAKDEYKIVKSLQERYDWMESNTRVIIQVMRIIFIIIAISSIGISTGIVLNDINLKLKTIWHANEKIEVKFIEGNYPNNICYSIDKEFVKCIGDTHVNNLINNFKFQKFVKLISNGESLIGIDSGYKFISKQLNEYPAINITENIFDVKQNNNLICYNNEIEINCIHKKIYPNIVSAFRNNINYCISAYNNVECYDELYEQSYTLDDKSGFELLASGYVVNCGTRYTLLLCWGRNDYGLLDIPEPLNTGVTILSLGETNNCAGDTHQIYCWGLDYSDNDFNLNILPNEISGEVQMIEVGYFNICAVSLNRLICWGFSKFGINDIPPDYVEGVYVFSLNTYQICAYKSYLKCWGSTNEYIDDIPQHVLNINIELIKLSYGYMCVSNEYLFHCWGEYYELIIKDYVPEYLYQGVNQLAVGINYLCAGIANEIGCYGSYINYNKESEPKYISDNMKLNWSLSSNNSKISYIKFCGDYICIFKGYTFCIRKSVKSIIRYNIPFEIIQSSNYKISSFGTICSNVNGRLYCQNNLDFNTDDFNLNFDVPKDFYTDTDLFSIGDLHICASKLDLTNCWGYDSFGQLDIPESISYVTSLSASGHSTCASTPSKLICWGEYIDSSDDFEPDPVHDVPNNLKAGVDEVYTGGIFACALKSQIPYCWGQNTYGAIDIPIMFEDGGIVLMSVSSYHVCAQNSIILKCWGRTVGFYPKYLESGVEMLDSCGDTNCGVYNDEWICWGIDFIPQRFLVSSQFSYNNNVLNYDIVDEYNICLKYKESLECRNDQYTNSYYYNKIIINEYFFCMYMNINKTYVCIVDNKIKSRFICILASFDYQDDNSFEYTGNSKIIKISCGTNHGCAMFESGEVHCFGGLAEYNEAQLPKEMSIGAYDIRAGHNSTCVLTSTQIICIGEDMNRIKDEYSLSTLQGFERLLN